MINMCCVTVTADTAAADGRGGGWGGDGDATAWPGGRTVGAGSTGSVLPGDTHDTQHPAPPCAPSQYHPAGRTDLHTPPTGESSLQEI